MTIELTGSTSSMGTGWRVPVRRREQPAQCLQLGGLIVDETGVLAEDVVPAGACGMLQPEHGVGIEQVRGPVATPLVLAAGPQPLMGARGGILGVGVVVTGLVLGEDVFDADAAELRLGAGEVRVDEAAG